MRISEEIQRIISSSRKRDSKLQRASRYQEKPPRSRGENSHFCAQRPEVPSRAAWNTPTKYTTARISATSRNQKAACKRHWTAASLGVSCPKASLEKQKKTVKAMKSFRTHLPPRASIMGGLGFCSGKAKLSQLQRKGKYRIKFGIQSPKTV